MIEDVSVHSQPVFCGTDYSAGDRDAIMETVAMPRSLRATVKVVFEQADIEVPGLLVSTAVDIVASKYFRGRLATPERASAKQMINRVADTIAGWGLKTDISKR